MKELFEYNSGELKKLEMKLKEEMKSHFNIEGVFRTKKYI